MIFEYLQTYGIAVAFIAPWVGGDIIGVHSVGILAGTDIVPVLYAFAAVCLSEIGGVVGGAYIARQFRNAPFIQTIRKKINGVRGARILDTIDSLSFTHKLLATLSVRIIPGSRYIFIGTMSTVTMSLTSFALLFSVNTLIWNAVFFGSGYMIGKGLLLSPNTTLTIFFFILLYALILTPLFLGKVRNKKKQVDNQSTKKNG